MSEVREAGQVRGKRIQGGYARFKENLKNIVVRVLAERPMHGYEIMKRIEEITEGRWRPAPGALYPLLEQLRKDGLIEIDRIDDQGVRGGRKVVYRLSESGWKYLASILIDNAEYKVKIVEYYILEGARLLKEHGLEREAREVCERFLKAFEKLTEKAESC